MPSWRAASGGGSVDTVEIAVVVGVFGRAELAFHGDFTRGIAQVVELLALDRAQHAVDALAAAAATRHEGSSCELARLLLVEQPVEQRLAGQVRVEHLGRG